MVLDTSRMFLCSRVLSSPRQRRRRTAPALHSFLDKEMKQRVVGSGYRAAKACLLGIPRRRVGETIG
jgi:hypothetical protein